MASDAWNPSHYNQFQAARSQPAFDLIDLIEPQAAMQVVDLGCGDGRLTATLHERLPNARTLGIDSSPRMLAQAPADPAGRLMFQQGRIEDFAATASYDLVFSNAALHWAPDHEQLLARLVAALRPGGQLAVQLPAMFEHPSHLLAAELAQTPRFADALSGYVYRSPVLPLERYAELLFYAGAERQSVRAQVYGQVLATRDEVAEWLSGTLLTVYAERLPPEQYADFLAEFRAGLRRVLPDRRPFYYGYRRWLLWAKFR